MRERCAREASAHEYSFWFVSARVLIASVDRTLPSFNELRERGEGFLTEHLITRENSFKCQYADSFLAVSHRWLGGEGQPPDTDGVQLKKIREYLRAHPNVEWVWFDYWCMPQDRRTPEEKKDLVIMKNDLVTMAQNFVIIAKDLVTNIMRPKTV